MAITIAANIAETAILTYPACFPDSVVGFIADPARADVRFIEYLFRLMKGQLQHENVGTGSVQDNINLQTLNRLDLALPDLREQHAIAAILGALDDKIELNWRMNETLEAMARAIFKDWFVDFGPTRAKVAGQTPYLAPEIWSLFPDQLDDEGKPEGWEMRPLDRIADFLNGLALQKFPPTGDKFLPVIKISQLRTGEAGDGDKASCDLPTPYIVQDRDILFSWSGSLLQRVWTGGRGALNQHLFKVTSQEFPKWFFFRWIDFHMEDFRAIAAAKATTMGHIQRHHLAAAMTVVPTGNFMLEADTILGPIFERNNANALESRALAAIRDFLLPKLMSGEIRVKDAERALEDVA